MTKSTPEGARDYLVPARIHPGEWYALPQSPQLFKQMLMIAGYDRYYQVHDNFVILVFLSTTLFAFSNDLICFLQIARCFRDEDLRADRQPEFTQLDMEMAFMSHEDIMSMVEEMIRTIFDEVAGISLPETFQRLTYQEAMDKYGSDKPDLRFGYEFQDITDSVKDSSFKVFQQAQVVKGFRVANGERISNSRLKPKGDICQQAQAAGAPGLITLRVSENNDLQGAKAVVESLSESQKAGIVDKMSASNGDLLIFVAGDNDLVNKALDKVRQYIAHTLEEIPDDTHKLCWITDWPLLEWNEDEERFETLHHPFTAPNPEDLEAGMPLSDCRAVAYDLVYNGVEIGGGSLRIYRSDIQTMLFDVIGLGEEEARDKFGHLLDSLEIGAPPHGGIAFGLDRLSMLLAKCQSIRDVIAFPKTTQAQCLLTHAPSSVPKQQLDEIHVKQID